MFYFPPWSLSRTVFDNGSSGSFQMCIFSSNENLVCLQASTKQCPRGSEKNENNESGAVLREMKGSDEKLWGLESKNSWILRCLTSNWLSNTSKTPNKTRQGIFSTTIASFQMCFTYTRAVKCCASSVLFFSATHLTCWIHLESITPLHVIF